LLRGGNQSDSSPSRTEEILIVPDSLSSTNFFSTPAQLLPVDPLPNERHHLPLFVSTISSLFSSVSLLSLFDISSLLLTFLLLPPFFFSWLPWPLFLLSALPVIAPLLLRALPLSPVFVL